MDVNGKWKLMSADNVAEICDAVGTTQENKEKAIQLMSPGGNVSQDINIDGENVLVVYNIPGKTIEVKTTMGQSVDMPFFDGRILNCVFSVEGEKLMEKQTGAFDAINIRYRQGDQLIMKMTCKGVTTTRVYERM